MKASKLGNFRGCASKGDDALLTRGYCNWKDATGDKRGGFASHERSHVHKYCLELLSKPCRGVAEMLSSSHVRQMATNRDYLRKVLEKNNFSRKTRPAF